MRGMSVRSSKGEPPETDKSWGEIIGDAAGVAKSLLTKIKHTASSILAPVPHDAQEGQGAAAKPVPRQAPPPQAPLEPFRGAGGLLPGLVGRAVGGLLSGALSALSAQLEAAAREQQGTYEEAAAQLRASAKLRNRLGPVTVGPLASQSSSSSSFNGVTSRQVMLVMPVYGAGGRGGVAQVTAVEDASRGNSMRITVRMDDGAVVVVDDGSGGGGGGGRGTVIDAEFREIRK